eukprot:jgi/Botrbrau1/9236/Bobra.0028s0031.1
MKFLLLKHPCCTGANWQAPVHKYVPAFTRYITSLAVALALLGRPAGDIIAAILQCSQQLHGKQLHCLNWCPMYKKGEGGLPRIPVQWGIPVGILHNRFINIT